MWVHVDAFLKQLGRNSGLFTAANNLSLSTSPLPVDQKNNQKTTSSHPLSNSLLSSLFSFPLLFSLFSLSLFSLLLPFSFLSLSSFSLSFSVAPLLGGASWVLYR